MLLLLLLILLLLGALFNLFRMIMWKVAPPSYYMVSRHIAKCEKW